MFQVKNEIKKDIYIRNRYVIDVQKAKENNNNRPKLVEIPLTSNFEKKNYMFDHQSKHIKTWEIVVIAIACMNCF